MAVEEQNLASSSAGMELQERQTVANPAELLQKSLSGLDKFGGFQLLKGLIKGVENMDPRRKAIKNVFLNDSAYEDARNRLKNELSLWVEILESGGKDPMEIVDSCKEECQKRKEISARICSAFMTRYATLKPLTEVLMPSLQMRDKVRLIASPL